MNYNSKLHSIDNKPCLAWSARLVPAVWCRKDSTRSVNAELQGVVHEHFGSESTDVAEQGMTTVGYYKRQIPETSLLNDCSVLDMVQPLNAAQYSHYCMKTSVNLLKPDCLCHQMV